MIKACFLPTNESHRQISLHRLHTILHIVEKVADQFPNSCVKLPPIKHFRLQILITCTRVVVVLHACNRACKIFFGPAASPLRYSMDFTLSVCFITQEILEVLVSKLVTIDLFYNWPHFINLNRNRDFLRLISPPEES